MSERHLDSSGIVAIAELTAPASPRLVREALAAASQVRVGAGHAECGVLLALGPREMAALFETRLEGEPDERLAICTLVADASLTPSAARDVRDAASRLLRAEGLAALAWRVVEGEHHSWCEQLLIGRGHRARGELDLALAAARESLQARYAEEVVVGSLAPGVLRYRAPVAPHELMGCFADLADERMAARVVIVQVDTCRADAEPHDALAAWRVFGPGQRLAFDGALASLTANRRALADSLGAVPRPVSTARLQTSGAMLDRTLERLTTSGAARDIAEGLRFMLPPPRPALADADARQRYDAERRRLGALGAWEGPAAVAGTDGQMLVGAVDRLGQRTLRFASSATCRVVLSSEPVRGLIDEGDVVVDGQLAAGEMIVADTGSGRLLLPGRADVAAQPHTTSDNSSTLLELGEAAAARRTHARLTLDEPALRRFAWSERRRAALARTVADGAEPIEGLAGRASLALLDDGTARVSELLHQRVTGVIVDPSDEGRGIELDVFVGPAQGRQVALSHPLLDERSMAALWRAFALRDEACRVDATCDATADERAMKQRMHEVIEQATAAAAEGRGLIVLSDALVTSSERLPLPMVLLVGALHRALSARGLRRSVSVVAECGEVHEGHDVAALVAYGATAVYPFALLALARRGARTAAAADQAQARATRALLETLRRAIANAGLTSVIGYRGAARFDAVGLDEDVVDYFIEGTRFRLGGRTLGDLWHDVRQRVHPAGSAPLELDPKSSSLLRDRLELVQCENVSAERAWLERQSSTAIMREVIMRDASRAPNVRRGRIDLVAPTDHPHPRGARDVVRLAEIERRAGAAEIEVRLPCVGELDRLLAAAVAAGADLITLAGYGGRNDEHYLDHVRHAGVALELSLAEAHRWLVKSGARASLRLRVEAAPRDGSALATLIALGADEVSLVARGPAGDGAHASSAANDSLTPRRWAGRALARELRIVLARLGLWRCSELVGRADLLRVRAQTTRGGNAQLARALSPLLVAWPVAGRPLVSSAQSPPPRDAADDGPARTGLAFAARHTELRHQGFVGDLAAARLGEGARVIVTAPAGLRAAAPLLLVGDDAGYAASGGELYVAGRAAERFGARNAGATLVAEVVGTRAFEGMRCGLGLILSAPSRGFAASITGGRIYLPASPRQREVLPAWIEPRPLDSQHKTQLRQLLQRFADATASPRARRLLASWPESAASFVVIDVADCGAKQQAHG